MSQNTHYHPDSGTWFELGECESCGGAVQEVNAVKLLTPELVPDLIHVSWLPPEISHNDETGITDCDHCR